MTGLFFFWFLSPYIKYPTLTFHLPGLLVSKIIFLQPTDHRLAAASFLSVVADYFKAQIVSNWFLQDDNAAK